MTRLPTPLTLLRTFEVAGRHLSFTLAAQELCITPSAVSQQMRSLEQQLGITLFERRPRALALTAAGEAYWRQIQQHLEALEECTRALLDKGPAAPLRVSLMPPMASRVVLPALADFYQRHPEIQLHIDASLRNLDLSRHEADLAIRFGTPPWQGCHWEKLLDLYVLPVCPPDMARQQDLAHHPEHLARVPLIQMTERPDAWQRYFEALGLGTAETSQQYFVDDYPAAIEAAETIGVALALLPLEQPLLDSQRLAAPWPAQGPMPEAVYAVMRKQDRSRSDISSFLHWLKARLAQQPG